MSLWRDCSEWSFINMTVLAVLRIQVGSKRHDLSCNDAVAVQSSDLLTQESFLCFFDNLNLESEQGEIQLICFSRVGGLKEAACFWVIHALKPNNRSQQWSKEKCIGDHMQDLSIWDSWNKMLQLDPLLSQSMFTVLLQSAGERVALLYKMLKLSLGENGRRGIHRLSLGRGEDILVKTQLHQMFK